MDSADVIVLVHGTFATNAAWTRPDHSFYKTLKAKIDGRIEIFVWSGENSHEARLAAGDQLAKFVRALKLPLQAHAHVIAHSHGGNVALYALRDAEFSDRVASLCFMGTPFLEVRNRNVSKGLRFFASAVGWLALFPGTPFLMMLWSSIIYGPISLAIGDSAAFITSFFALVGFGIYAGRWYVPDHRRRLKIWLYQLLWPTLRSVQIAMNDRFRFGKASCRVLVGRVNLDEARAWLAAIGDIAIAPLLIWEFARKFLPGATLILLVWSVVLAGLTKEVGCCHTSRDAVAWIFLLMVFFCILAVLIPAANIVISTLIRGNKFTFGWEGWLTHLVLDLSPMALPKWSQPEIYELTFRPVHYSSYRHCAFYDDDWFVERLVMWLRGCSHVGIRVAANAEQTGASIPWNKVVLGAWLLLVGWLVLASVFPLQILAWPLAPH